MKSEESPHSLLDGERGNKETLPVEDRQRKATVPRTDGAPGKLPRFDESEG